MQETHSANNDQIGGIIKDLMGSISTPIRVLGVTANAFLDTADYLGSIKSLAMKIEEPVADCRRDIETRFVAARICPGRYSFFIVNFGNIKYNYMTAHQDKSPVPVYVLRLSSRRQPRVFRSESQDRELAETLAYLHGLHGYEDPLPLFDDHTKIVQYPCSRNLQDNLRCKPQP